MKKEFKLSIIIAWFGRYPDWIDLFFRSCGDNEGIDFLIFTDCEKRESMNHSNIKYNKLSLREFYNKFEFALGSDSNYADNPAYKLCDFRPLYGQALKEYLVGYTHWGVCDSDLVFGNLDNFIDKTADIFSTHKNFISGHFFYVKNINFINNSFKQIRGYKKALISESSFGLDEGSWSNIFIPKSKKQKILRLFWMIFGFNFKIIDKELCTTPHNGIPWADGSDVYPDFWIYQKNKLFAKKNQTWTEVPYVHFMNWKSRKYLPECYENPPWDGVDLKNCENIWQEDAVKISVYGFAAVSNGELEKIKMALA